MLANTLAPLAAVVPSHVYAEDTGAPEKVSTSSEDGDKTAEGQDSVDGKTDEDEKVSVGDSDTGENKEEENGDKIENKNLGDGGDVVDPQAPNILEDGVMDYNPPNDIEEVVEVTEIPMPVKGAATASSGTEPAPLPSDTEPITTIEISETEPSPVVDPEVSVVEEPVGTLEVKEYETLTENMEVEDSTEEYWNVDGEVAKTINKVKLGVKYIFPLDKEVSVTFTKLPELEKDRDYLKIERVKVDDLNLPDDFKTNAEYAFDITTFNEDRDKPMKNGEDFEYDLTLPKPKGVDIEVKYTEDGNTYESVDNNIEVKSNVVSIEGLDHFSTYCVGNRVLSAKPTPVEAETIPEWCKITISEGQSIQEAINKSSVEEPLTICIEPGVYKENLIIDHPVKLIGLLNDSSKEGVVIVGANTEPTIHILNTKNVTIDRFTFQGANGPYGAIHINNSNNCTIKNNVFLKNSLDIFTDHGSQHTITNNKFNGENLAIKGNSTESSLVGNTFSNYSTAIAIGEEHKISKNQFVNNTIQIETGTMTEIIETYLSQNTFDRAVIVRKNPIAVGKIFSRIQDAVDAATDGDTIQVLSGTYEGIVNINKPLSLVGVKENSPIILGGFVINTSGVVSIENMNFKVPTGTPVDGISITKVETLSVEHSNFDGSDLFLTGKRGIMSNYSQSNVTVGNSNFSNGYYTAIQGKYNELNISNTTISNCKSGINFQSGNDLTVTDTNISVVAKGNTNDTYAVRFASESANTGKDMILNGGKYVVDKKGFTADPGIYHSAIIVRSGASGVLKANNLSLGGEVVNLSSNELDAINNWWGDASGPKDTVPNDGSILNQNPNGKGSSAIGAVKYAPWYKDAGMKNLTSANAITQDATNINLYDATLNGTNGSYDAIGHSFWVSLSPFSTDSPNIPSNVYSTQDFGTIKANTDFSASLSSITNSGIPGNLPPITPNTTYYYVAWSLVDGTWYPGEVKSFTTLPINAPTNGVPNGIYVTTNEFDFTWNASTDASTITYEFQSSLNPSQVDGVLTKGLWKSETLPTNTIHSSGASDGTWYWQVRAKDATGNYSDWSDIWTVTIDTTAPTKPVITNTPDNAFTNINAITINWKGGDDQGTNPSGIKGYIIGYVFTSANGNTVTDWTSGLVEVGNPKTHSGTYGHGEGKYVIYVKTVDNAGNESPESEPYTITYDKTPPSAPTLSSPANNSVVNGSILTNTWSKVDDAVKYIYASYNDENATSLRFTNTYTTTSKSAYNVQNANIWWRVKSVDAAGNESEWSDLWKVTIDNDKPTGDIISIYYPDKGMSVNSFTTNDNTPILEGTYSDANIATIVLKIDSTEQHLTYENNKWRTSEPTTSLSDGEHTATLTITDKAGNSFTTEEKLFIDTVAPTATFEHYKDNVKINETTNPITYVKNIDQLSFTAKYTDTEPSSGLYQDSYAIFEAQDDGSFNFMRNGKKVFCDWRKEPNLVTDLSGAIYSLTVKEEFKNCIATLPDGEYYMAHQVYDRATRKDIPSINQFRDVLGLHFVIDNTSPTTTITTPEENTSWSEPIDIKGYSTDNNGIDSVSLEYAPYYLVAGTGTCGTYTAITTTTNTLTTFSYDSTTDKYDWSFENWTPTEGEGSYCIKAYATDNAGNVEHTAEIKNVTYDITIPEITLTTNPTDPDGGNDWFKTKPTITLTATDSFDIDRVEYQWGSKTGSWTTYTSPFKPDSEGKLVLYYRSIDKAGNESVGVKNIKVDTNKPSSVSNVKATYNENENSITLDWDVEDSDIEEVRVYKGKSSDFDTDSLNRISKQSADDENYTDKGDLDISISRGNTYYYKLVAIDSAGNRSNTKKVSIEIPEEGGAPVVAVEEGVVEGAGAGEEEEGQVAGEETGPEGEGVAKGTEGEEGSVLGEETAKASGGQSIFKSFWFWLILVVLGALIIWLINKKSEDGTKTKKKYM